MKVLKQTLVYGHNVRMTCRCYYGYYCTRHFSQNSGSFDISTWLKQNYLDTNLFKSSDLLPILDTFNLTTPRGTNNAPEGEKGGTSFGLLLKLFNPQSEPEDWGGRLSQLPR